MSNIVPNSGKKSGHILKANAVYFQRRLFAKFSVFLFLSILYRLLKHLVRTKISQYFKIIIFFLITEVWPISITLLWFDDVADNSWLWTERFEFVRIMQTLQLVSCIRASGYRSVIINKRRAVCFCTWTHAIVQNYM